MALVYAKITYDIIKIALKVNEMCVVVVMTINYDANEIVPLV